MIQYRRCKLNNDPSDLNALPEWLAAEGLEGPASPSKRPVDEAKYIVIPADHGIF